MIRIDSDLPQEPDEIEKRLAADTQYIWSHAYDEQFVGRLKSYCRGILWVLGWILRKRDLHLSVSWLQVPAVVIPEDLYPEDCAATDYQRLLSVTLNATTRSLMDTTLFGYSRRAARYCFRFFTRARGAGSVPQAVVKVPAMAGASEAASAGATTLFSLAGVTATTTTAHAVTTVATLSTIVTVSTGIAVAVVLTASGVPSVMTLLNLGDSETAKSGTRHVDERSGTAVEWGVWDAGPTPDSPVDAAVDAGIDAAPAAPADGGVPVAVAGDGGLVDLATPVDAGVAPVIQDAQAARRPRRQRRDTGAAVSSVARDAGLTVVVVDEPENGADAAAWPTSTAVSDPTLNPGPGNLIRPPTPPPRKVATAREARTKDVAEYEMALGKEIQKLRVGGSTRIMPSRPVLSDMGRNQQTRLRGIFRPCMDKAGRVTEVRVMRSTGYGEYDDDVVAGVKKWLHSPYRVDNKAVHVCWQLEYAYTLSER